MYIPVHESTGCFATWAPKLFAYYLGHVTPLFKWYGSQLRKNFATVFACSTFNFGPSTISFPHTDPGNLPFGWCAVTVLKPFDLKQGGHLILWDIKLVIEFPPGSTILLPSVVIRHSNLPVKKARSITPSLSTLPGGFSDGWTTDFKRNTSIEIAYRRMGGL